MDKKCLIPILFLLTILFSFQVYSTDYVRCTETTNTTTLIRLNTSTCSNIYVDNDDLYYGLYNLTPAQTFTVQNLYTDILGTNLSTLNLEATSISAIKNVTLASNISNVLGNGNYTLNATAGTIYLNLTSTTFKDVTLRVTYNKTFTSADNLYLSTTQTYPAILGGTACIKLSGYHTLIDGFNYSASWILQANCTEVLVDYGTLLVGLPKTGEYFTGFMKNIAPGLAGILFIIGFMVALVMIVVSIGKAVEKKAGK